jgi:hypothetical protein
MIKGEDVDEEAEAIGVPVNSVIAVDENAVNGTQGELNRRLRSGRRREANSGRFEGCILVVPLSYTSQG